MKSFYKISLAVVSLMLVSSASISYAETAVNVVGEGEYCGGETIIPRTCSTGLTCSNTRDADVDVPGICVAKVNPYAVEITGAQRTALDTFMDKVERVGGAKNQKEYIFLLSGLIAKLNDYKAYYQSPLHMNTGKVSMVDYLVYEMNALKVSVGSIAGAGTTLPALPFCAQPPMPECPAGMMCMMVMPAPKTYTNYTDWEKDHAKFLHTGACEMDAMAQ